MLSSVHVDEKDDPSLLDLTFSDKGNEFRLLLTYKTTQETDSNRETLKHFLRAARYLDPTIQNFSIDFSDEKAIHVKGNLFNALAMLKGANFISEKLYQSINTNTLLEKFINDSKKVDSTPSEKTKDEALQAAKLPEANLLLKNIFEIYKTLNTTEQQKLLSDLAKGFNTLGVKLTVGTGTSQQQASTVRLKFNQ